MIPKMLRRKARPLANKSTSGNERGKQHSSECMGIQYKAIDDANDSGKENSINGMILRPTDKTNPLVYGTSSMISCAMASSKVAHSLDDNVAENYDYRTATSPREAKVIHPVVCKRDIFIGGRLPTGEPSETEKRKNQPARMSFVSASMLCGRMDRDGGHAQYRLRDSARKGIVDPRQMYGKRTGGSHAAGAARSSRPPRIVTAQLPSGPAGPSSTVSELSYASSAWASPPAIRQQTIEEEEDCQEQEMGEDAILRGEEDD